MVKDLIIIGAGNPDIVRLIEDINADKLSFNLLGFTEIDERMIGNKFWGYPILGNDAILNTERFKNAMIINNTYASQKVRKLTNAKFESYFDRFCNLIHPSVRLGKIEMGRGNIIADGIVIQSGVKIKNHNIIHSNTIISHETIIGSNCLFSVNVTIGSRSIIGDFCYFGISSTTIPELTISDGCYIGGGSVLINSLKENSKVFGNPARLLPNK